MFTICDSDTIHVLSVLPSIGQIRANGFLYFEGRLREVREIHITRNGIQIELIH